MKIDKALRHCYVEQLTSNEIVRKEAIALIEGRKSKAWHFTERLKSMESYAQKIEMGLFTDQYVIDDFFACTLVVRNSLDIAEALSLVDDLFVIVERRPISVRATHRAPSDFTFDDLRLYVRLRSPEYLPPRAISGITFEVQIKTFLQHAWGIATHDLTYKTDAVSWAKVRVAHQIRAMLEHAELTIEQIEHLSASASIYKTNKDYEQITQIIAIVRSFWPPEKLPRDLQRLAKCVQRITRMSQITIQEVEECLDSETKNGRGAKLENLSPYGIIMQALLNHHSEKFRNIGRGKDKKPIIIYQDIEVPETLNEIKSSIFHVV